MNAARRRSRRAKATQDIAATNRPGEHLGDLEPVPEHAEPEREAIGDQEAVDSTGGGVRSNPDQNWRGLGIRGRADSGAQPGARTRREKSSPGQGARPTRETGRRRGGSRLAGAPAERK
jgi:hypothetical protein